MTRELTKKVDALSMAITAAEEGAKVKDRATGTELQHAHDELERLEQEHAKAVDELRVAVAAGKDAKKERETLLDTGRRLDDQRLVIESLSDVAPIPDADAADAAVAALRAVIEQAGADSESARVRQSEIDREIEALTQERKDLDSQIWTCRNLTHHMSRDALKVMAIYEAAHGPIDVTGHACGGNDVDAKCRFIVGIARGIEATPAGRSLTK